MDKSYIENHIINNNIDIKTLSPIKLITILMEHIETIKNINGEEKKNYVIRILNDFINTDDNIFIKANNNNLIINIKLLLDSKVVSDIIDTVVLCVDGAVNINNQIKSSCCIPKK